MQDYESTDLEGAAYLAREADAYSIDDYTPEQEYEDSMRYEAMSDSELMSEVSRRSIAEFGYCPFDSYDPLPDDVPF